ncbi:hypothetical protein [Pseudonocardia alaniniphila]|uniref:Antibiotic biosynthesis monooxygenase n=1 Tax=Pseudonocardia alaniniphila TaxID=75291 RepID=A0ABS9TUG5_9PSEU|nr:hypothetical protein [Pseudonocardia alaniniphila]MCH6172136.1 hypothetical protein [Pseudonocardia alaniniphila]
MYQHLVAFTIRPERRDDFARAAEKTAFLSEAITSAGDPTWLMRENVIGAEGPAS